MEGPKYSKELPWPNQPKINSGQYYPFYVNVKTIESNPHHIFWLVIGSLIFVTVIAWVEILRAIFNGWKQENKSQILFTITLTIITIILICIFTQIK